DVDLFLVAFAGSSMFWKGRLVLLAAKSFQLVEDRAKDVGLVVRDCAGELGEVFCALNDCGGALQTQSGIDVTLRKRPKASVGVSVELDENQIPNLDAAWVVFVHERAAGVAVWRKIDVQFRARAARTGVTHHPEIIFLVAVNDVNRRIEVGLAK